MTKFSLAAAVTATIAIAGTGAAIATTGGSPSPVSTTSFSPESAFGGQTPTPQTPAGQTPAIDEKRAVEIAQQRVPGAKVVDVELDDDGAKEWEIELRAGDKEYDVDVSSVDGRILEFDEETDRDDDKDDRDDRDDDDRDDDKDDHDDRDDDRDDRDDRD
ncbi:PepSY domain-containing protein [Sinosporangium siamense]|uniref:PepSY domain-containing protein n=2 Tax=Sinosporangium siamense TaxID=1367973 RepID=A0A919V5H6_9ACTN|nr:PepSY domain-containing protein [Sinosporangium siamense]GII89927.1 hypothetical protein Ssi02_01580 [Sinosporangium siamense]